MEALVTVQNTSIWMGWTVHWVMDIGRLQECD